MKTKIIHIFLVAGLVLGTFAMSGAALASPSVAPISPVTFTILHTNDFHGQLEEVQVSPATSSNPGMARVATIVNNVRTEVGANKVLLVDAGDEMQGSLLSNLQEGLPTIDVFNTMEYAVATFGNHEFDWGQTTLSDRMIQSAYPYVSANIVVNDTGNCATAGWGKPSFVDNPYEIKTIRFERDGSWSEVAMIEESRA